MSRTGRRSAKGHPFPEHFTRLIEEAGASAYQWHDEAFAEWVDQGGLWHRVARWLRYGSIIALALGLAALLIVRMEWLPVVAGIGVGVGFVLSRWRTIPWIAGALALLAAYDTAAGGQTAIGGIALTALVGGVLIRPRHRDMTFALAALPLAALTALWSKSELYPTLAFLIVLIAFGTAVWSSGLRSIPRPFARVGVNDLTARPPSPPSRLPWLVRMVKARDIEDEPDDVRRKKIGADGERRTAIILLALRRGRGTRIAHDVAIPGADSANADHVVLARSGLFIIDSKQFGSQNDPGLVTYDQGSREIVHRTNKGSRSIEKSLRTAAWAVEGIGNLVGVQGRAILAIHNAAVSKNLIVERNGIEVEIIPSWSLPDRIDNGATVLSLPQLATATMSMYRMRSSTTGRSPHITSPRGATKDAEQRMRALDSEASGPESVHQRKRTTPIPPAGPPRAQGERAQRQPPRTTSAPPSATRPQRPVDQRAQQAPTPPAPATKVQQAPDAEPVLSAKDRVADRWEQMRLSEPAAPDEVEHELRVVRRGTKIVLIEFSDGDVRSRDMVAMTGVCGSVEGNYIWYCTPEQYNIYETHGRQVNVATISTGKVMVKPEGAL